MKGALGIAAGVVAAVVCSAGIAHATGVADRAILRVEPAVVKAAADGELVVRVVTDSPIELSGAQASLEFDPTILRVESVSPAGPYASARFVVPDDLAAVASRANETGRIAQVAAAFVPPDAVPAGVATFLVVRFRVVGCGETALRLPTGPRDAQAIDGRSDVYGYEVPVSTEGGSVTTCVPADEVTPMELDAAPVAAAAGPPWALLAASGVALLALLAIAGVARARARRRPVP